MNDLLKTIKNNPFKFLAGLIIGIGIYFLVNYAYSALK
jgi:hypothetical protein